MLTRQLPRHWKLLFRHRTGAPVMRAENALLTAYIYVDVRDGDIGGYVRDAHRQSA